MNENGEVPVFSFAHACDLVHQVHYDVFTALLDIPEGGSACSNGCTCCERQSTKDIIRTKERTIVNDNIIGNIFGAGALCIYRLVFYFTSPSVYSQFANVYVA